MRKTPYEEILKAIKKIIAEGVDAARHNADWQDVVTGWSVGRLVQENLLLDEGPSPANARAVRKIARGTHRHHSYFYTAARVFRAYPVLPKESSLKWGHYVLLAMVPDAAKRRRLEKKAIKADLEIKALYRLIQDDREKNNPAFLPLEEEKQLPLVRGKLHHYKITLRENIKLNDGFGLVDVGFRGLREIFLGKNRKCHSGNIVRSIKEGEEFTARAVTYKDNLLYTYKAFVDRVVDGDTLIASIDCGFRFWSCQRLRLRGINAPEIKESAGRRVKEFIQKALNKVEFIVIKTYWEEKYGRFLADIFYLPGEPDPAKVAAEGIFLNQELLDKGLAEVWEK